MVGYEIVILIALGIIIIRNFTKDKSDGRGILGGGKRQDKKVQK